MPLDRVKGIVGDEQGRTCGKLVSEYTGGRKNPYGEEDGTLWESDNSHHSDLSGNLYRGVCAARFFGGGKLIDRAADFVNEMARAKGRVHYTTIALAGVIMMFPFAVLPVTVSTLYRRSWLSKQAEKWLSEHTQNEN